MKETDGLTERQIAVLDLVLERKTSKEIALALGISPHTVDQRIASARRKLRANSRAELARIYERHRSTYEQTVYQLPQLADSPEQPQEPRRAHSVEPVFTLSDVVTFQQPLPWSQTPTRLAGLEALDQRFGVFGRLGAILILSTTLAVLLLVAIAISDSLGHLS